jgi:tartrate dehydratase beta subunit/fumarate hydratase class I family protein
MLNLFKDFPSSPFFFALSEIFVRFQICLAYPELGMEAIWKIEVVDFPAFILVDDKGNDFFKQLE